jgi:hypothetical protein
MQQPTIIRAPFSFGQLSLWRSIQGIPPESCNLPQLWALPSGTSIASVEHALRTLEERHESLRTRYEAEGPHGLTQAVWESGTVSLESVPCDEGGHGAGGAGVADGTAAAVAAGLADAPFDLAADRPWRARAVTRAGSPSHLAICFHHIAVDAWAINQLHEEFLALLDGRPLPGTVPNSRELAEEQWSAAREGRRKSARKHWQKVFEAAPPMERDLARDAVTSRWAKTGSTAAADAAGRIAARLEVSLPSVVLAAFCLALTRRTGHDRVVVAVYTNNRSDPRWENLVAAQNQIIPLLFPSVPGEEFDATVLRVHWELLRSYRHGSYNVDDVLGIGREHGYTGSVNGNFDGSVSGFFSNFFNYLGEYQRDQTSPGEEMETGTAGRNIGAPLYLQVQDGESLTCTLRENSSGSGFDRVTGLLRALQDIILAAGEQE